MNALSRLLFVVFVVGAFAQSTAGEFAKQVPAESFLYLEIKDFPAQQARLSEIPALDRLKNFEWQKLLLQLYQIGIENVQNFTADAQSPSTEEVEAVLVGAEEKWQELQSHLNGDIAFSVGNFQNTLSVFKFNATVRESLDLSSIQLGEEDLTDAELAELEARLAQEELLNAQEAASILSQFRLWVDVKDGDILEKKVAEWLGESLQSGAHKQERIALTQQAWNGTNLYILGVPEKADLAVLAWAIKGDTWIIAFTADALKESLKNLETPPENSLAKQKSFQDAASFVGASDSLLYIDYSPVDALLREVLAEIPLGTMAAVPQAEAMMEWLALDAFIPYVLGARIEKEGISTKGRYGYTRETALSRISIDPDAGPAEVPAFLHQNVDQFASFNWNLGNGWSRLETEIMGLAPQAVAGMGLARMLASGQVGFDIKLQFMDHLEGGMVFVQAMDPDVIKKILEASRADDPARVMQVQMEHPTGGQNYLIAFKMKNQAGIEEAMNRLLARFHPNGNPEPVLFEDQAITYPIPETLQGGKFKSFVSYTYLDDYLLLAIGDDKLLKNSIVASKDPSLQLVNNKAFKSIREKSLANPNSIEYSSGEQQKNTLNLLQSTLRTLQTENTDLEIPDLSPLAGLIHQSINTTLRKGLVFEIDGLIEFAPAK